jgi:hypothetical protein
MATKTPAKAPAKLQPVHKVLRNLEIAYGKKCAELDAALKRIAELEKEREYRIS